MESVDVVVVGAGLSGLTCAHLAHRAGLDVVVLEARDRVGGRTLSVDVEGVRFDLGGQWIGGTQHRVAALADALGLETFPQFHDGDKVLEVGRERATYKGTIPSLPLLSLIQLQRGLLELRWTAHRQVLSGVADDRTLADWLDDRGARDDVRAVITAAMRVVFGADPDELSWREFLAYIKAAGGVMPLLEIEDAAQERRFVDGAQSLSLGLAQRLAGRVRVDAAVRRVAAVTGGVEVESEAGTFAARRAVVAVPPRHAAAIAFDPGLPAGRRRWLEGTPMGRTIKCLVGYERAFWRDAGRSGEAVSSDGPISVTFDATSADATLPALVAFVVGRPADALRGAGEAGRRTAVVDHLTRLFGGEARDVAVYRDRDWSEDPWAGGCPVALPAPGLDVAAVDPREPVGPIHWAGTETATAWRGYLEGAVEAGQRAGREVVAEVRGVAAANAWERAGVAQITEVGR